MLFRSVDVTMYSNSKYRMEEGDQWSKIQLDPDNQLTEAERDSFRSLCEEFKDVINPRPGRYNGCFGPMESSIDFSSKPPPNAKVYMPNYSESMKQKLGEKMDQMMDFGVLDYPENHGIQVEYISPSLLVPKPGEPGEWRFVTDFSGANRYIRKFPSYSPNINEARRALSRAR